MLEGHRNCTKCKQIKPFAEFHRHKDCKDGFNSVCKECRKPLSRADWSSKSLKRKILDRAKGRAIRKKLDFDLELEDIIIPELCPVFKAPIKVPSIDRIDSLRGYTKDNIRIIENRANMLKNNATIEEIRLILADLEK